MSKLICDQIKCFKGVISKKIIFKDVANSISKIILIYEN